MAIFRDLVFFHGKSYHLGETLVRMTDIQLDDGVVCDRYDIARLESIRQQLADMPYRPFIDPDDFILDPINGLYTPIDIWFARWGIEYDLDDMMDGTVGTWSLTDDSSDEDSYQECITAEEEQSLCEDTCIMIVMDPFDELLGSEEWPITEEEFDNDRWSTENGL